MRSAQLVSIVLATSLVATARVGPLAAQETILQNDGYVDGQSVGFQAGFIASEMAASRFLPTGSSPWRVNRVRFLFGGATTTQTIRLHIWEDGAGTTNPGTQRFASDYVVTGSNTAMQEIDLTANNVLVNGQFRAAIEFQHNGLPSVARDGDGTIQPTKNFIFTPSGGGWFQSSAVGVTGDWIIRAGVTQTTTGVPEEKTLTFALATVGPNPSRDSRLLLSLTLPTGAPARLELLDVSGRRVASQEVGALGAGRHMVELADGGDLASGLYLARLSQGVNARTIRLVVMR
jgi:hypothetical protein